MEIIMDDDIKQYLTAKETWIRGAYILLFALFYSVAEFILFALVVFQFLAILLTGQPNTRARELGQSISTYFYQIIQFMSANTDQRPYPFSPWPDGPPPSVESAQGTHQDSTTVASDSDAEGHF